jgi:hypothetical protein
MTKRNFNGRNAHVTTVLAAQANRYVLYMKGDVNMSRLTLQLRNRCKSLLFLSFVMAVTALFLGGINVTSAGANSSEPKNSYEYHAIRDQKVDPNLHPAHRARLQREAAIKNRENTRKFIKDVMAGKDTAGGAK